MQPHPSVISLLAACLYIAVVVACIFARSTAVGQRQVSWHAHAWTGIALLFLVMAVLRVVSAEDLLREELRDLLRGAGAYEDRRKVQGPIVALILLIGAFVSGLWVFNVTRKIRGRRNIATAIAIGGACLLLTLYLLRIVSLHALDALLYGPLKFNWVIDIGATAVVLACSIYYRRVVTGRA